MDFPPVMPGQTSTYTRVRKTEATSLSTSGFRYAQGVDTAVIRYLASIGKRGGEAGSGASKVRGNKSYYQRIAKESVKARRAKRKESKS
jgi:hypothetical protein